MSQFYIFFVIIVTICLLIPVSIGSTQYVFFFQTSRLVTLESPMTISTNSFQFMETNNTIYKLRMALQSLSNYYLSRVYSTLLEQPCLLYN